MKELYSNLTKYEKKISWRSRFGAIYRLYLSKLWAHLIKDKRTWIFNTFMLLPILAGPLLAIISIVQDSTISTDAFYSNYSDVMFIGYFGLIIPFFTMYIASMLFNDEKNDRTITYFTIRPINRFELVIVKYLAYLTIVPIFTGVTTGLVYFSFAVFGQFQYITMALWYFLGAIVATVVYGAFFMFIGLLFKNPLWFGLFFALIWEFVFASFSQTFTKLTIAYYVKSLLVTDLFPNNPFKGSPIIIGLNQAGAWESANSIASPIVYTVVLAIIIVVSLTLSWSQLQGDKFTVPYGAGKRPGGWRYYLKEIRSFLITFGIVFIAVGIAVGPISGQRKILRQTVDVNIDISSYAYISDPEYVPSLTEMGYGDSISYSFAKGDSIDISFSYRYSSVGNTQYRGMIVKPQVFNTFLENTQDLWSDYYAIIYNNYSLSDIYFPILMNNYFSEVNTLLSQAEESVLITEITQPDINFVSEEGGIYNIVLVVSNFDTDTNQYLNGDIEIDITGDVFRLAGYVFGWIVFGIGIIIMGFATYSLITYSSEDEIKRYEEQQERILAAKKLKEENETAK